MLNRFQFARLRGFRRGKKKDRTPDASAQRAQSGVEVATRDGGDEVRDRWNDEDRVARLLERRAAAQDAEREAARQRMGGGAAPPGTERRTNPAESRSTPPNPPRPSGASAPAVSRADTRTTTAPAPRTTTRPVDVTGPVPDALDDPKLLREQGLSGDEGLLRAPRGEQGLLDERGRRREGTDTATGRPDRAAPDRHAPDRAVPGRATGSARVVCIASGKGGTGKSVLATNLALIRARRGERVLLVDFDAGLANDHLLLGLAPPYDVGHVMTGEVSAQEALVEGPGGIKLLAGGVGRQAMIDPTRRELDRLFKALAPLESEFDLILVDHGAGLSYSTVAHLAATSTLILVTNHEVTALSDGYALYKRAHMVNHGIRVGLVVNRAPDETIARGAWERFRGAAHKFLGHTPELIGWVPVDPAIPQAVQMRSPAALSFPGCDAVHALEKIADWAPIEHARSATPFYERARRALR